MNSDETPQHISTPDIQTELNGADQDNQQSSELKECLAQKDEWKNQCLRTVAEFENYKKRIEKEKTVWIISAKSSVLNDILTIIDDFERAFAQSESTSIPAGFELIYKAFQKFLENQGVQEISSVLEFDPILHEAIMQVSSEQHAPNHIVQVLQKGYMFKGAVLRPAKVSVAK